MEVIKANPESISEVFNKTYIIPAYQRKYSWDEEKCEDLWYDIIEKYEEDKEGEYFLGTTVLIKNDNNKFEVIDGQQRLTSLIILLRALYDNHQYPGIRKKMYIYDELTEKIDESKIRIESKVIDENKNDLMDIIFHDGDNLEDTNIFKINYNLFKEKIKDWKKDNKNNLEDFINFLLSNVKILPIDCGDQDNALKIFQTLNDRGTPLNDSDIFKSQIYYLLDEKEKTNFINFWNEDINSNYDWYFRIYMHILRAKEKIQDNEINLRKFFKDRINKDNVIQIIEDLRKILLIGNYNNKEIYKYLDLMYIYPVDIVINIYYVFMHKYSYINSKNEVELKPKDEKYLYNIMKDLIKYIYIKGVIYKTRNAIKNDIYKAYIKIYENKLNNIFPDMNEEKIEFRKSLKNLSNRDKYTKPILFLYHILNKDQSIIENYDKLHIEHILPKAYQNYDSWSEKDYYTYINTLGNLTLLEKKNNIRAKNEFFNKKKEIYKNSKILDVKEGLCKLKNWTPDECKRRFKDMQNRLESFLFDNNI